MMNSCMQTMSSLQMTGYKNIDELFSLTRKSFHNLIREDEQQQIETSIWKQIDAGNNNDYITFIFEKQTALTFLCLITEESWKTSNTEEYFMYCLWTGRTCIFITVINFPDNRKNTVW